MVELEHPCFDPFCDEPGAQRIACIIVADCRHRPGHYRGQSGTHRHDLRERLWAPAAYADQRDGWRWACADHAQRALEGQAAATALRDAAPSRRTSRLRRKR